MSTVMAYLLCTFQVKDFTIYYYFFIFFAIKTRRIICCINNNYRN